MHPLDPENPDPPPFMIRDGRSRIGLRVLPESGWLHRDDRNAAERALKLRLMAEHDDCVRCLPEGEQPAQELLGLIETVTGERAESDLPAIDAAGRLVQEDLCVLEPGTLRLVAASVCFPQGWLLPTKMGLSMRDIHQPVGYYDPIASPADRVVGGLDDRVRWRANWFVVGSDRMRSEPGHPLDGPIRLHLRFERQTLRKLPETGAIVFTIRSYISPIEAIDDRPALQRGLLHALETMSVAERQYHGNLEPAEMAKVHLQARLGL